MGRRKRVTAIVETDKGIVLVSHSRHGKPTFMLPGGHIRKKETLMGAVTRELYEETGLHASEVQYLFELPTKHNLHKVFFIKTYGDLKKSHETTHINFWNDSTKDKLKVSWHVKPIIEKYKNKSEYVIEESVDTKESISVKEIQEPKEKYRDKKKHKQFFKQDKKRRKRKYSIWQKIKYRSRKARIPLWFLLCFIAMILVAIIHQYYVIKIATVDLSIFFYILEIIVIGYVVFWLIKRFDRIRVHNNMRLFGLRILSLLLGFTGLALFYFIFIGPVFALFDENIASVLYFGADFGLPLTGKIFFTVFGLGLSIIGCYLFFKFKRKTGQFVWFGRA
jgi:ADP-ribose pyrophosphatase YjhB (NUDIX family)